MASRPVRIPEYLAVKVDAVAQEESRSFSGAVAMLIERGLRSMPPSSGTLAEREPPDETGVAAASGSGQGALDRTSRKARSANVKKAPAETDDHFKPDPKK